MVVLAWYGKGDDCFFTVCGSDKGPIGLGASTRFLPQSAKAVRPETSQMVIYDPRQMKGI